MVRPCCTALTSVAKLSSSRITFAAFLVTSVPEIPIATPISASFTAGASFTPSPVIATISPLDLNALTILSLSAGLTLANTEILSSKSSSSVSVSAESSSPVSAISPLWKIPACFAISIAVSLWSPVIITVLI